MRSSDCRANCQEQLNLLCIKKKWPTVSTAITCIKAWDGCGCGNIWIPCVPPLSSSLLSHRKKPAGLHANTIRHVTMHALWRGIANPSVLNSIWNSSHKTMNCCGILLRSQPSASPVTHCTLCSLRHTCTPWLSWRAVHKSLPSALSQQGR